MYNRRAECLSHSLSEKLPEGDYRHLVVTLPKKMGSLLTETGGDNPKGRSPPPQEPDHGTEADSHFSDDQNQAPPGWEEWDAA